MRQALFLFVFFTSNFIAYSTETTIQGSLSGFNGRVLKVYAVGDYITQTKTEVAKATITDNSFKVSFSLEGTQQLFLKVEDKQTSLFAKAGEVYNLSLAYDEEANSGNAFDKYLNLKFTYPRANEINQSIKNFNTAYQDFFSENYQQFILKAAKEETNAFIAEWKEKSKLEGNQFVANYIKYALANLEDINSTPKDELFESYLKDQPILYRNKEYMNFFAQLYHRSFEQFVLTKNGAEVLKALMIEEDLEKTLSLIQKHKKLHTVEFSELYLIYGLFEVYHKKTINQENSISILEKVSAKGKNEYNQEIAKNIISSLKGIADNEQAPAFTLENEKGEKVSLIDFIGKPIYLGFWADWSIPSLRELQVMKTLEEKYGGTIHFVSINLDEDPEKMKSAKAKNNYDWTFLSFDDDFELKEKYGVKTVPSYYLIDEKGMMIAAPALGPTEIERTLYELIK